LTEILLASSDVRCVVTSKKKLISCDVAVLSPPPDALPHREGRIAGSQPLGTSGFGLESFNSSQRPSARYTVWCGEGHFVLNFSAPELFFFLILAHLYIKCRNYFFLILAHPVYKMPVLFFF